MYCAKIIIPKMTNTYKLYVYRSTNAEDINTIAKIKTIMPTFEIDESIAESQMINGQECYVLLDKADEEQTGIIYNGPVPNTVPVIEYETEIGIEKINDYTYVNKLLLNPLPTKYNGTMYYYSVIGVDEANNLITHLSKVNGVMITSPFLNEGTRHLYSSNGDNIWNYVSSVEWTNDIVIGNINDPALFDRYGLPFVETVPIFEPTEVTASLRPVNHGNFIVLEIPNVWQNNNKDYNYRKLKSYKIQNVCDEQYSNFSEPTYQSLLPVTIEKMLILKKTDLENPDTVIEPSDMEAEVYQIIRKNGLYYNPLEHRKLSMNKYNIPLGEDTAVFSEGSVQDQIKMQIEATPGHTYTYTIYLYDVYGKQSAPCTFTVTT